MRKLLGERARSVLERMQKSVISNTLNIARTFKLNSRALRTPFLGFFFSRNPETLRFFRVLEFDIILNRLLVEITTL